MAKSINTNFTVNVPKPIDSRMQVQSIVDLAGIPVKYNRMSTYVIDEDADYRYYENTQEWHPIVNTVEVSWGNIGGNIETQTDLINLLSTFAPAEHTHPQEPPLDHTHPTTDIEDNGVGTVVWDRPQMAPNFILVGGTPSVPEIGVLSFKVKGLATSPIEVLTSDTIIFGEGFSVQENKTITYTETDPTVPSHVKSITLEDLNEWNLGYQASLLLDGKEDKIDRILKTGAILVVGLTVNADANAFHWRVNGIEFTNTPELELPLTPATDGFYRTDIVVGTSSNTYRIIEGVESDVVPIEPSADPDTIKLASIPIFGDVVGQPNPIPTDNFVLKTEQYPIPIMGGGGGNISINNDSSYFEISNYGSQIRSFEDQQGYLYLGKEITIYNAGTTDLIFEHNPTLSEMNKVFLQLPNNTNFTLKPKEAFKLKKTSQSKATFVGVFQDVSGKADIDHTHTTSEITDFPTFKTIEGQPIIGTGNIDLSNGGVYWVNGSPGAVGGLSIETSTNLETHILIDGNLTGNAWAFPTAGTPYYVSINNALFTPTSIWRGLSYNYSSNVLTFLSDGVITGSVEPPIQLASLSNFADSLQNGYVRRALVWKKVLDNTQRLSIISNNGVGDGSIFFGPHRPFARYEPENIAYNGTSSIWYDTSGNENDAIIFGQMVNPTPWVAEIPTVDQTLIDGSTNAVSGNAVYDAFALAANQLELKSENSASALSGFEITNNGNGTLNINGGVALLRDQNDPYAILQKYTIPSVTNLAMVDNTNNFVLVDYNSGTPAIIVTQNPDTINGRTNSIIAGVSRVGTTIDYISLVGQGVDSWQKIRSRFLDTETVTRAKGLELGASGLAISCTPGIAYAGLNKLPVSLLNTHTQAHRNGSAWVRTTGLTNLNNTQYNNAGTLTTLTNGRFRVDYVYVLVDNPSKLYTIMGEVQYNTIADARLAPAPATLPTELQFLGTRVGRVIVEKNATTVEVSSEFNTVYRAGSVQNHNDLALLNTGDYNHFRATTSADAGKVLSVNSLGVVDFTTIPKAQFQSGELVDQLTIATATTEEKFQLNLQPLVSNKHTFTLASSVVFPVTVHIETKAGTPSGYDGTAVITASNNSFANGISPSFSNSYKVYMPNATTLVYEWVVGQEIYDGYWGDKLSLRVPENGVAKALTSKAYVDAGLALKAPLLSPAFTGIPTAPTATAGTNTTQIATTAFSINEINSRALLLSGNQNFSGTKSGNNGTGKQVEILGTLGSLQASTGSTNTTPAIYASSSNAQSAIRAVMTMGSTGDFLNCFGADATVKSRIDNLGNIIATSFIKSSAPTTNLLLAGGGDIAQSTFASTTHTHAISDVSGLQTELNNKENTSNKNAVNGYAGLDGNGKINPSQLPALAITDTFVVANQAAMLALTAEVGDVAVRTDLNKSFILRVTGASTLANWQELLTPTDAVSSVFGRSGVVTAQANDYNTSLVPENTNLYFTEGRVRNTPLTGYVSGAGTVAATDTLLQAIQKLNGNIANATHNPVTLGTANGLSLSTQQLSLGLASSGVTGALSGTDWNTFNSKANANGSNASGTWGINITGSASSASSTPLVSVDSSMLFGRNGLQYFNVSGLSGDNPATTNTPDDNWWHIIRGNHGNGAGYYTDLALPMTSDGKIRYRRISGGVSYGWTTVLDATNFNSYSLPLTGGTLTGKLLINADNANSWIAGHQNNALVSLTSTGTVGSFHPWISQRTPGGGFAVGVLGDSLYFNFATNSNIGSSNNTTTQVLKLDAAGTGSINNSPIITQGNHTSYISPATIGAAVAGHNHDGTYLKKGSDSNGGSYQLYSTDASGQYHNRALEIREVNLATTGSITPEYAPAIGFHWGGVNQIKLLLRNDGQLAVSNVSNSWGNPLIHTGNIGSQSVSYANSAGSVAWGNVSSRPTNLSQFTNDLGNYGGWITSSGSISGNAATVTINYNNDSNSTYQMLWGSGNSVFGTSAIYCNPSTDALYAKIFYDADNSAYYFDGSSTGDSIRVAGDIVAYFSDERLKDRKENISNALSKVMSLNGFYYTPNAKAQELGYVYREEVGVSAQEVERVLPEIIKNAPISDEYKTLDYGKLTPLLIEAIKEQQQQIVLLQTQLQNLQNR